MALVHFIVLFLLGIVHFSLEKECVGCPHKLDINDPALKKYLSNKLQDLKNVVPEGVHGESEMELVRVKDAEEKIVSGIQYSYQYEAKGLNTKQMYDCKLTVLKMPWLGSELVTEYSCNLLVSSGNKKISPGKEVTIDVENNPKLEELKPFVSQEIGKAQHSQYIMTVIKYLKATMQLVEGTIIRTTVQVGITDCPLDTETDDDKGCQHKLQGQQICDVTVWLKPWMKFKELMQVQCQPMKPINQECVGCPHKLDINDPELKKYLINELHNLKNVVPKGVHGESEMELVRVKDAEEKIVSGIQYSYQYEAKGLNTKQMYDCKLTVLKKPWLGSEQVTEYSCNLLVSSGNKKIAPGKEVVIDVENNPKLEELKPFVSQEIGKAQHSQYIMTVIKYLKATMQLVEGTIIRTTVQVGITDCPLDTETDDDKGCQHKLQGQQICDVTVWLKPWMKFKELMQVQCQPMKPTNQMCVGCPVEKDPNSPFIKQSLEKALYKYNEESKTSQKLTLVKINKATLQIMKGSKLTVYFDTKDVKSHTNFNCKSVIILPLSTSEEQTVEDFNCTPVSTN